MAKNTQYYSQKNHTVTIRPVVAGGFAEQNIQDFASGAAIKWEPSTTDIVTVTTGLDGSRISFASDNSGKITITLKPTSPSIPVLMWLYNQQRAGNPILCDVSIKSGVGDEVVLNNAGITTGSSETGDATMGTREFVFTGESLIEDPQYR